MVVPGNHTDDPPTSGDPAQYTQSDVDKAVSSAVENTISNIEIKLFEVLTNPASLDEGEWLPLGPTGRDFGSWNMLFRSSCTRLSRHTLPARWTYKRAEVRHNDRSETCSCRFNIQGSRDRPPLTSTPLNSNSAHNHAKQFWCRQYRQAK